jgi:molecular chaperone DnaJ
VELQAVRNFINARRYQEALTALSNIPNRNAMWYYYSAVANMGLGNNLVAVDHAKQAAAMEPGNMEYVNFANQLQYRGQYYQNTGYNYGRRSFGTGNLCCDLWIADTLCECMGGDLCACM